jgi:hypothetical protein
MKENEFIKDSRVGDPCVERSWEEDRRQVYDFVYWESGGIERRSGKERRQQQKRKSTWVNVSERSSVCIEDKDDQ